VISWYFHDKKIDSIKRPATRLTFIEVGSQGFFYSYRHVLLVEPGVQHNYPAEYNGELFRNIKGDCNKDLRDPDDKCKSVHAGGLEWYGDYIYVPDTVKGFRVFDVNDIFEVNGYLPSTTKFQKRKMGFFR